MICTNWWCNVALDQMMLTRDLPIISQICTDAVGLPRDLFLEDKKQMMKETHHCGRMSACCLVLVSQTSLLCVQTIVEGVLKEA
jgi:hypothetical protein